jgi:hypothetical protein
MLEQRARPSVSVMQRILIVALPCALASSACADVDIPQPPDMSSVVDAFQQPTAVLNGDQLQAVIVDSTAQREIIDRLGSLEAIISAATAGIAREPLDPLDVSEPERSTRKVLSFELSGEVGGRIRRVCGGWDDAQQPDRAKNGEMRLQFTATESGVGRVIWGDLEQCRITIPRSETRVQLDGEIQIYLVRARGFEFGSDYIVRLDASVAIDPQPPTQLALEFRLIGSRAVVIRVERPDGHLLYYGTANLTQPQLRDRDDTWACDLEAKTCESMSTQAVVRW